ncbi:ABC transporter ATP-binding protein [Azospirillum ramasamyi]|uniref:Histidine/lysine/arginine/ornithine ABC transporter ATP-binding protein n=1 Tax=Azospirillum ramasamyi TaxID=682998 RepID=A0A2U9S6C9_9PROT|nr:ABC transporter ATP-binding protein [Azospirillum ramasamyi]AWU94942.1 histidine/lysine/arginine/ornithine ABC transporter ATP-binding protein [Azospirillum ramasamyi]
MHRHPPVSDSAPAAVVVEDLHKRFGELEVLKGVSLTAREGDVITLIGSSGSGKSTLLRCINMLEIPDEGRVIIGGETIGLKKTRRGVTVPADTRQVERIRTSLGMVFQGFNLWTHMTILENVIEAPVHVLGVPKAEAIDRARRLLDKVGILAKADAYPVQLSGGQQQRAAIARALAMQPKVMLFDEPTSALDPELVGEVLRVIRQLADEGSTMILVTHEMGFAREVASKVVFLHQGRIEEEGSPDKVLTNPDSDRVRQFLSRHLSGAA